MKPNAVLIERHIKDAQAFARGEMFTVRGGGEAMAAGFVGMSGDKGSVVGFENGEFALRIFLKRGSGIMVRTEEKGSVAVFNASRMGEGMSGEPAYWGLV
ncbi:MAG TPA: hypothetical protein EYP34_08120 [Chromatiaceae bacterium]|nr:hypothetical protein [Chromatiaceae bacterium]